MQMHFAEALIYRWTNTQPHRVSTLRELNGHQCASCPLRRSPPRSSPLPQVSKSSWTCFDPSLINNLIPPRPRQLSTRRILVSHHCNIAPEVHWSRNPPCSLAVTLCPHHSHARYKCQHNPPIRSSWADRTSQWRSLSKSPNRLQSQIRPPKERCRCIDGRVQVC